MKRTVTVLQDDIDNGSERHPRQCAVARALRRDLADLLDGRPVWANGDSLWLNEPPSACRVQTPPVVAEFIVCYDQGLPVEPFKFEIEVPDQ